MTSNRPVKIREDLFWKLKALAATRKLGLTELLNDITEKEIKRAEKEEGVRLGS